VARTISAEDVSLDIACATRFLLSLQVETTICDEAAAEQRKDLLALASLPAGGPGASTAAAFGGSEGVARTRPDEASAAGAGNRTSCAWPPA